MLTITQAKRVFRSIMSDGHKPAYMYRSIQREGGFFIGRIERMCNGTWCAISKNGCHFKAEGHFENIRQAKRWIHENYS